MTLSDRVRAEGVLPAAFPVIDELAPRQIEVCERGGLPWVYVGYLYLGFVAHWRGEWDEAERQLRSAAELEPPGAFSGQGTGHLAVHLAHQGRVDEVRAIAERQPLPALDRVNSLGIWNAMLLLTEALYLVGARDEAAAMRPRVEAFLAIGAPEWLLFDGRITETVGGIAAAAAGDWEQAEARYRSAAATAARMGHRIELAEIARFHAQALLERGGTHNAARAMSLLEDALARYRTLGMPRHAALVETTLARLVAPEA
jgi:tetratricopeptide (TPR) repeat protein